MPEQNSTRLPLVTLNLLVVAVLVIQITGLGSRTTSIPSGSTVVSLEPVLDALEEIKMAVADRPSLASTPTPGREPLDTRSLEETRAALQRAVEAILKMSGEGGLGGASLEIPRETWIQNPEPNVAMIEGTRSDLTSDRDATMRRFLLMSPADVLATFGRPISVGANSRHISWSYRVAEQHALTVYFIGGYVSRIQ